MNALFAMKAKHGSQDSHVFLIRTKRRRPRSFSVVPHLQLLRLRREFIKCLQAPRINSLPLLVNLDPLLQCQLVPVSSFIRNV
jgi:hypothetical protein